MRLHPPCSILLLVPELVKADLWHQGFKVVSEGLLRVESGPGAGVDCLGEGGDSRQQLGRQRLGTFLGWGERVCRDQNSSCKVLGVPRFSTTNTAMQCNIIFVVQRKMYYRFSKNFCNSEKLKGSADCKIFDFKWILSGWRTHQNIDCLFFH